MRTAKELFRSSPDFKGYQEIVANAAFESACNAALLVMIEDLPKHTGDPAASWDCHCQIVGARKVLEKLSELHLKDEAPTKEKWPTLKYETRTPPPKIK